MGFVEKDILGLFSVTSDCIAIKIWDLVNDTSSSLMKRILEGYLHVKEL